MRKVLIALGFIQLVSCAAVSAQGLVDLHLLCQYSPCSDCVRSKERQLEEQQRNRILIASLAAAALCLLSASCIVRPDG